MGGARYPLSLLLLTVVSTNRGQDEESGLDSALDESEVMDNVLQSSNYERTFRVRVGIAATECYFFDLKKGNTINVEYMVLESNPRNGSPLDVTVLIKDPDKTVIGRMFRKSTGMVQDLALPSTGQYEICIMNRWGPRFVKTVVWNILVRGMVDSQAFKRRMLEEMKKYADVDSERCVNRLMEIEQYLHQSSTFMLMSTAFRSKDINYMEALTDMIDYWSAFHVCLLVSTVAGQVYFLKKLFICEPNTHGV